MLELEPPGAEIEPTKVSVKLVTEVPSYFLSPPGWDSWDTCGFYGFYGDIFFIISQ